ncbi:hypothetical protein N8151_02000, partial [Flavobacteriaceae bacterium]|nr:hypothetical protein [Flavobacteriaceae bacterium]
MRFTIVFFFFLNTFSQDPKIISTALSADSTSIIITFSEPVYNSTGGSGNLETSDFTLSLCGGNATLLSSTPTSIAVVGNVYTLGLPLTGITNGFEKVTVWPSSSSAIYDASDNSALPSDYVTSGLLLDLNSKDCNSFSWTSTGNTLSTTWNDLSGNNNNFTTAGSPAYDINNGLVFANGQITDYFIKSSFPHPTSTYSDEFLIKTSRETNSFWKSYSVLGTDNESLIGYYLNSNDFYIVRFPLAYYTGVGFADGNWHHLVITSDRVSGAEIIYLDGGLAYQSTRGAGALLETSGTYVIGQDQDNLGGGFDANQAFEGFIPVVRMYDKVLSPLEVTQNYNHISQYIENNNRVILNAGVSLDSDGDGLSNDNEITIGTNPYVFEDNDGDGIADHFDPDDDNDGILDSIECGFVNGGLVNGGFEIGTNGCDSIVNQSSIDGWFTTATDSSMEIWCDGRVLSSITYNAREGNRFAEINANETAALYQAINTIPGGYMIWSASHLSRGNTTVQTINIRAGISTSTSSIIDTRTATITWQDYTGIYLVPAGQASTVFLFEATSGGGYGNLLDRISFDRPASACTLDTDGDGIRNSFDLDSDGDGILDAIEGGIVDTDGDGTLNFLDIDSDGDGLLDNAELNINDEDGDGIVDYLDPQAPGYTVSPTSVIVNESGTVTKSISVKLDRAPTSNVIISIAVVDATEVSISLTTLTFTSLNWNTEQILVVTGVDDSDRDSDIDSNLMFSIVDASSDDTFDGLSDQIVQVTNQDDDPEVCIPRDFDDSDFTFILDAIHTSGSDTFSLTPDLGTKRGMVWFQNKLDLRVSFSLDVDLFLGNNDNGADGIAFVIQNISTSQGSTGGGLGYQGINPSYAIEMDTYHNGSPRDGNSPSDHIAFVNDGTANLAPTSGDLIQVSNLENGEWHNIVINWNPVTTRLDYTFTRTGGGTYSDFKTIDLIGDVLNSNIGYWGFTAATGGAKNLQQVRFDNDSICVTDEILPPTSTNEVSGVSTQTICATPSPTLNDLKKTASRPEGVDPGSDFSGVSYNLVWFSSATGTSTFLPATTILVDGSTYYVEAGSLSDPTAASYRQSLSRLKVIVDLVYGSYTLVPPSLNIIEGTTVATFSLVLNDEPSSSVIYDLVSSDISHLIVSTSSMTFTTLNWNVSQVGTLTTVDNLIADGLQSSNFTVRINDPLSDDCFFDPTPLPTYAIQIADDDVPAYTLSSVSGTLLEGNPQTATVSLVLLV